MDLLFAHCSDLGVEVEWEDLGERDRGFYLDDRRVIVLNRRLTRAQATAALAHEVGHAVFGDRCSTPRHERRASEYGASLIITPRQYAAAEALVGHHLGALAAELGVTPHLIEAWQRWADRRLPLERRRRLGIEKTLTAP
ncbi:ImmA/IrrE family metallo-endopeptidase [Nocardioides sp.]|uniref:ImmA/IrrE family metallo-endopeptidase n=1 Tax=Nocardioides sp. TaxID=35761 RepID=UPI0035B2A2D1